jgi:hypothetical protein
MPPCFHQLAALLQRVTSSISLFGLVANDVSEGGFHHDLTHSL